MKVAVIGYGYWGPNLVRNFAWTEGVDVKYVCDLSQERLDKVKGMFPSVEHTTTNLQEVLDDPEVEAIAISTPTSGHFPIAKAALEAGKHVLVEKPMTDNYKDGKILVDLAATKGLTLMTDHTFIYTGAVRKIKELIDAGEIGDIYYFDSVRVNLGLFQSDVNVMWDLAPHDLSIMLYCLDKKPRAVSAHGMAHVKGQPVNTAYMTVYFDDTTIAHFNVNWLSPIKVRMTMIGGTKKMIVWDDNLNSEKIKVYDTGVHLNDKDEDIYKALISYRTGDMYSPQVANIEALKLECSHFVESIQNKTKPDTDGAFGLTIVAMLEAAQQSLDNEGKIISLEDL
ncbi:MAG: Gfo/Idh/MocA family oxidoreductase [SAR324 cluster bacterium]|nr:Gfo/Idh/MocA family oxidoreductase [SAR324 cluster bacterium]